MPSAMKGTQSQSASALKAAATATLKVPDHTMPAGTGDVATLKLPPGGVPRPAGAQTWSTPAETLAAKRAASGTVLPITTIWDDAAAENNQTRLIGNLATKADHMANVCEDEKRQRAEQREHMDQLHELQMEKLGEIGQEVDSALENLGSHVDAFSEKFRGILGDTFDKLHSELRERVEALGPRMAVLERRSENLKAGIAQERADRIRQNEEILVPLKAQVARATADLDREQAVRRNREAELKKQMADAVEAFEQAQEAEKKAREEKLRHVAEECRREQARLRKRHQAVEEAAKRLFDELSKESDMEREARILAQDPVVEGLTRFLKDFQKDCQEQAELS